jgi:hypothetical protein
MTTQYIDITPTWRGILPSLLVLYNNPKTRSVGLKELQRMADLADRFVAKSNEVKP